MTLSHPKDAGKFTIRFFDKNLSHVILTVKKDSEKSVLFCRWGSQGASERSVKKKLNLLWNLKFNFFSVAERPLTFFAYFLNAKKVGRRRLVIGPAKAGAFLFSHTRLPFPPRPLLPFGRISPAAKPRVRLPAPPFGFAAQNQARHFAARNHPVRLSASQP